MEFGGDTINFKVSESIENPNDVRSCFAIDVIKNIEQESSTPIKNDEFRTTNEEGIGVKHKEHAPILKPSNLVKSTPCASVDSAATSLQHIGDPSPPIHSHISTNRFLPCMVQVPNQIQTGGNNYIDFGKRNAIIRKDHYPLPFIDPMHKYFEEHVMEEIHLHALSPNRA
ncbi:hypothetical protein PS2_043370 [Malus domestica]